MITFTQKSRELKMGMFDTVQAPCPSCGTTLQFQSKEGWCVLNNFSLNKVPLVIALDLDEDNKKWCSQQSCCGKKYTLVLKEKLDIPKYVQMEIKEIDD
jgi:hypothetical protein